MRASGCAAVCVVTELVDVHASLGVGIVATDVPCYISWGRLGGLFEGDGALDVRVTSQNSNWTYVSCMAGQMANERKRID